MQSLAANAALRCLVVCSVPCQALQLSKAWLEPELVGLAAQLAPTLTHLSLDDSCEIEPSPEALCMALPQLRCLQLIFRERYCGTSIRWPTVSERLLMHPSLRQLLLSGPASAEWVGGWGYNQATEWVQQLLAACSAVSTAAHPQGTLTVQLPHLCKKELAAARKLWARLAARTSPRAKTKSASWLVVTDVDGRDMLAAAM
jgi:hypothetical protein